MLKVSCGCVLQQAAELEVEKVKCEVCRQSDKNKLDEDEELISCSACSRSGTVYCLFLFFFFSCSSCSTGAADNIFDRNYATGLLTKQQHGGSLKSVE